MRQIINNDRKEKRLKNYPPFSHDPSATFLDFLVVYTTPTIIK